ncbi:MAG: hypothetical protein NTV02_02690 [Candidatus Zambryskibacteria bacterium]|nr:hypothetical protein [Candidatus Zambryskibacteria bacterium]
MKNTLRIIGIICVLGGGTFFFREWALKEFNGAFSSLDSSFASVQHTAAVIEAVDNGLTSLENSTTTATALYTGPDNFVFATPLKNAVLYQGCSYPLVWTASSTIKNLKLSLFDAGTRRVVDSSLSGIPEQFTGDSAKNMYWKVGLRVWPGEYFIQLMELNDTAQEEKSYRFKIDSMAPELGIGEQKSVCEDSGGVLQ